jgi:ADP-heptose:LPS heptosyltransferase
VAEKPETLLVLRALGLGDLLTAVPALRALAAAFPDARRVLAAPRALEPLVALVGPDPRRAPRARERAIHAVLDVPAWVGRSAAPEVDVAARLPACAVAVNLHGSGPQSHRLLLASRPARLIAFRHRDVAESAGGPPWDASEHEVARWCRLLGASGIPADPTALDLPCPSGAEPRRRARGRGAGAQLAPTLLHPGAASPARRWPPERWAAVARAERARGREVLVSGSATEAPLARRIADAAGLPPRAVAAGATDVAQLAELVASAGRVVCGDTGVAHLATALRTPSVVLFGPTPPSAWGPPPDRPWHCAMWHGSGGDPHGACTDAGLLRIEPGEVLAALAELSPAPLD